MRERVANFGPPGVTARPVPPRATFPSTAMPPVSSGSIPHLLLMMHRARSADPSEFSAHLDSLSRALERSNHQVTISRDPVESQQILTQVRPNIIVLDPLITRANAAEFDMVARLQTDEDPVPLIFLVDSIDELQEIRRVDALIKNFLVRPFRVEELEHRIEDAMREHERFLKMREHARRLEGEVIRDFKTGLYTERHFRHLLSQEFQRAERHRFPLSFLLLDIDDFKRINDDCEYAFGDYVLEEFAQILQQSIREIDHAARFGGDEFMVLLPNTTPAEAVQVAGRIRSALERRVFDDGNYRIQATTSIGIDTYDGRSLSSASDLRRRANQALKDAKRRGKNRIWLYSGARVNPRHEAQEAPPLDTPPQDHPQSEPDSPPAPPEQSSDPDAR